MASLGIDKAEGALARGHNEWELVYVKVGERGDRILVDVLRIWVIDSHSDRPVVNEEEMLLTTVEDHPIGSVFAETLDSFNLEEDGLSLHG